MIFKKITIIEYNKFLYFNIKNLKIFLSSSNPFTFLVNKTLVPIFYLFIYIFNSTSDMKRFYMFIDIEYSL